MESGWEFRIAELASYIFLFSFGIMRKEEKEMWIDSNVMALILFAVWFIFGWAYMSEMDRLEELESADDED